MLDYTDPTAETSDEEAELSSLDDLIQVLLDSIPEASNAAPENAEW